MSVKTGELKRGDFVKTWYDEGGRYGGNNVIMLGIVRKAGPKTFTTEWPAGGRSRIHYDNSADFRKAEDSLIKDESDYLARKGWLKTCEECGKPVVRGACACEGESPITV